MNLFEKIVKEYLRENRSNSDAYARFVDDEPHKGVYCFHCTPAGKGISKTGARRQYTGSFAGNMYGDALYATYTLASAKNNWFTYASGEDRAMIKFICHSDLKHFIFFDPIFCAQVHGRAKNIREQIEFIFGDNYDKLYILNHPRFATLEKYFNPNSYTADGARYMWSVINEIEQTKGINLRGKYIQGLVYSGHNDGNCIIPFDFSSLEPIEISRDGGNTFEPIDTTSWVHGELLKNNIDLKNSLRDKYNYFRTEGFVGDYAVVGLNFRYRILNKKLFKMFYKDGSDGAISPIWFDEVYGQTFSNTNERMVRFKGNVYIIKAVNYATYLVYDTDGHFLCKLEDLEKYSKGIVNKNIKQPQRVTRNITDDELDDF